MAAYPFLIKSKNKVLLKLHKEIYGKDLLSAAKEETGMVSAIFTQKKHYLVELDTDTKTDYLEFLNHLIYLKRAK
jgi:hypothetical protein